MVFLVVDASGPENAGAGSEPEMVGSVQHNCLFNTHTHPDMAKHDNRTMAACEGE